jgi:uncharacterized membrane protein YjgN (DUF898 family)
MDASVVHTSEPMTFSGRSGEYFRIWIVNVCLTVVTLGIYSAWAKVRRLKYLYRSTHVAGGSFDYHASPMAILKGRLIGLGAVSVYLVSGYLLPGVEAPIFLLILAFIPWVLVRSRMFNMRNTSFQNIRFSFQRVYGRAYEVIFGYGLLVGVTMGIMYPYYRYKRSDLIVSNASFGNWPIKLGVISSEFYVKYLQATLIFLLVMVLFGLFLASGIDVSDLLPGNEENTDRSPGTVYSITLGIVGLLIAYFIVFSFLRAATTKLVLNNTTVGEHKLNCHWNIPRVMFIQTSNLVAIVLSAGLLIPWATIRLRRYQIENLSIAVTGRIDAVMAVQSEEVSAMGDELGEAFDIDIGL